MKLTVHNCAFRVLEDIDIDAKWDARNADATVNRYVAAVTECLKRDMSRFTEVQRSHLRQIFEAMRHAHRAVRELLRPEGEQPLSVNVMPIVRAQLETLYAICLLTEKPGCLADYLKDGWKKLFVRHLMMRQECSAFPRMMEGLLEWHRRIEQMRLISAVSDEEKKTIEADEVGMKLPAAFVRATIAPFPTPKKVIGKITDPDRKQMLMRLYPDYEFFCGYVHFSPATDILSSLLDPRQPYRQMFTSGQIADMYQTHVAGPAMWYNAISVIQSCSELVKVYPEDIELSRCCAEAWKQLSESSLVGKVIWELRTKKLLGVIS